MWHLWWVSLFLGNHGVGIRFKKRWHLDLVAKYSLFHEKVAACSFHKTCGLASLQFWPEKFQLNFEVEQTVLLQTVVAHFCRANIQNKLSWNGGLCHPYVTSELQNYLLTFHKVKFSWSYSIKAVVYLIENFKSQSFPSVVNAFLLWFK